MSLIEALSETVVRRPERGIAFLDRRGRRGERRLYPRLLAGWRASARRLGASGVGERAPVFVCLGASWEFLDVWFGALLAGALPVAVAPPLVLGASRHQFTTLAALVERFEPALIVTSPLTRDRARDLGLSSLAGRMVAPEELAAREPSPGALRTTAAGDDLAFLQFTSGSTGVPRAVAIPHRAVLATTAAIDAATPPPHSAVSPDGAATVVSWLPLHHDMGLVGCLLFALVNGHDLDFLSQRAFLGRPATWLHAVAAAPHVFSPAPNFAYQACVERVRPKDLVDMDLGGWRVAVTGSEMIRPETADAFCRRFAAAGFQRRALVAAYGMAETTLTITMDQRGEGVRTRAAPAAVDEPERIVCSVGAPVRGMRVQVVAPDGSALPEGRVGEVRAAGDAVFAGYHADPDATAECLHDGWLRTGDLGFVADGELYITGRIKDLIIVNGQNVMPHELEWHAEAVTDGGGTCRAGAFAVADARGSEAPVLVVEIDPAGEPDLAGAAREVKVRVARETGLALADVAFVRRGTIPKTSSGKVRRAELCSRYLAAELERIDAQTD